jgi:hypothetical protein
MKSGNASPTRNSCAIFSAQNAPYRGTVRDESRLTGGYRFWCNKGGLFKPSLKILVGCCKDLSHSPFSLPPNNHSRLFFFRRRMSILFLVLCVICAPGGRVWRLLQYLKIQCFVILSGAKNLVFSTGYSSFTPFRMTEKMALQQFVG